MGKTKSPAKRGTPSAKPSPSPTPSFALRDDIAKGQARQHLTRSLFDRIAKSYDRMNLVLSLGSDPRWKRLLVSLLPEHPAPVCLDVACGTGDLMFAVAKRYPKANITGLDISPAMLAEARRRALNEIPGRGIDTLEHPMESAPVKAGSVDILTAGYALRNSADLPVALDRIASWLKPGGTGAFLEFSKPRSRILQSLELAFLWAWGGLWGHLVQKNRHIYQYLGESLKRYPDHPALRKAFEDRGLAFVHDRPLYFGMLRVFVVRRSVMKRTRK